MEQQPRRSNPLQLMLMQRNMALGGIIGSGAKFAFSLASPHTWQKIEQLMDVTPPTIVSDKVDTTVHGTSRLKRSIGGMQAVTDTVLKIMRDSYSSEAPNQNQLFALAQAQTRLWFRLEIPADSNLLTTLFEAYEFQGRVNDFKPMTPILQRQEVDVTIVFDDVSLVRYEPYASVIG